MKKRLHMMSGKKCISSLLVLIVLSLRQFVYPGSQQGYLKGRRIEKKPITLQDPKSSRNRRSRPPRQGSPVQLPASPMDLEKDIKRDTISTAELRKQNWTSLCRKAAVNTNSSVLITGGISQPPGVALALLLAKQCHVRRIAIADPLTPNLRKIRMAAMNTYRLLERRIPQFQLIVPDSGLEREKGGGMDWLLLFQPTHVIHLERDSNPEMLSMEDDSSERLGRSLYTLQNSFLSMEQLLVYRLLQLRGAASAPTLLHVTLAPSSDLATSMHSLLSSFYRSTHEMSIKQLQLPAIYGPTTKLPSHSETDPMIYIDDAVAAILVALEHRKGWHGITVQPGPVTGKWLASQMGKSSKENKSIKARVAQTLAWELDQEHPYGTSSDMNFSALSYPPNLDKAAAAYQNTYGLENRPFPCASACSSPISQKCTPSVYDGILSISRRVTANCTYVLYTVNFGRNLNGSAMEVDRKETSSVCRVAFVSGQSPLISHLENRLNGKLQWNGWTLVWLPNNYDGTLTDVAYGLPRIEPSRFFADSVTKAMYTESTGIAIAEDTALLTFFRQADQSAKPTRYRSEKRSGTSVRRFFIVPEEPARNVIMFAGEPPQDVMPSSITDFTSRVPPKQLTFYQRAAHWVQVNHLRPDKERAQIIYKKFPFQWIAKSFIIHDLKTDEGRQLRCSWYDEYLYWGSNRGVEELSLAFVIAKQRIEGSIGPGTEDDSNWAPVIDKVSGKPRMNENGAEIYLRFIERKPTSEGDK